MVEIVIATHGGFAKGIVSTLEMIAGNADAVTALSVEEGDDPGAFLETLKNTVDALNARPDSEGTLILVDLFGGTPSNSALQLLGREGTDKIRCITGLNFPMLVEAVFSRENKSLPELETACMEAASRGVQSLAELLSASNS